MIDYCEKDTLAVLFEHQPTMERRFGYWGVGSNDSYDYRVFIPSTEEYIEVSVTYLEKLSDGGYRPKEGGKVCKTIPEIVDFILESDDAYGIAERVTSIKKYSRLLNAFCLMAIKENNNLYEYLKAKYEDSSNEALAEAWVQECSHNIRGMCKMYKEKL